MVDAVINQHIQYHLDCLTDKRVLIVTMPDLIVGYSYYKPVKDLIIDLTYINNHAGAYDFILIDYATNYLRGEIEEQLCQQLCQHTLPKPWAIITSDFKYYNQQHQHIVYYPIYLIDGLDKGRYSMIDVKRARSHTVSFMTYHYHWHRLLILIELYTKIGFDSCLLNLYEIDKMTESQRQSLEHSRKMLTLDERALVDDMFKLAPITADPKDSQSEIVNIDNRSFSDSCINVFSESDYPANFITEKSVKPFLSGQFFAVVGSAAGYQHLRDLGFDLFDDYIPMPTHAQFRENIREVVDAIASMMPNIQKIWDDTYPRRANNYGWSRSKQLRDNLTKHLYTQLNNI